MQVTDHPMLRWVIPLVGFVSTKAAIKGAAVVQDSGNGHACFGCCINLLSRLQELAVLGVNDTNTTADHRAIDLEAEAIGDEFNRLMTKSTYKGKNVFVSAAGGEYVAMGGRSAEMSFGIATIDYSAGVYGHRN